MSNITTLKDTTWVIPKGFIVSAGYGEFNINGSYIGDYSGATTKEFTSFRLGYDSYGANANYFRTENAVSPNSHSYTVTFTGGTDVTNPDLIKWLDEWGELQGGEEEEPTVPIKKFTRLYIGGTVASSGGKCFKRLTTEQPSEEITDLTGTTWYVPSGWEAEAGYGIFIIDAYVTPNYGSNNWATMRIGYNALKNPSADQIGITTATGGGTAIGPSKSFTITFNGGEDVDHPKLIEWLKTYGELQ